LFVLYAHVHAPIEAHGTPQGIVWEREYYRPFHLSQVRRANGTLQGTWWDTKFLWDRQMTQDLNRFTDTCGNVTIHSFGMGFVGYSTSPRVKIIDVIGLTDKAISGLPKDYLLPNPRPGHPLRYIPVSYLASQGDISLLQDWWIAIR